MNECLNFVFTLPVVSRLQLIKINKQFYTIASIQHQDYYPRAKLMANVENRESAFANDKTRASMSEIGYRVSIRTSNE